MTPLEQQYQKMAEEKYPIDFREDESCFNGNFSFDHNNRDRSIYLEGLKDSDKVNRWISVEDNPLIRKTGDHSWITCHPCDESIMFAIDTNYGWYIKYGFISEDGDLMIIEEEDNECSGYSVLDIEYYFFINPPIRTEKT